MKEMKTESWSTGGQRLIVGSADPGTMAQDARASEVPCTAWQRLKMLASSCDGHYLTVLYGWLT